MKIVFKGSTFVKMYGGEVTYQNLVNFVKTNYPELGSFSLSFLDEDGDSVMVASQLDVDTMKQMYEGKQIMRIDVTASNQESSKKDQNPKEQTVQKPHENIQGEKDIKREKTHEKHHHGKHGRHGHKKSEQKRFRQKRECPYIEDKISKIVEQKIYSLMPCFVNQVHNCSVNGLQKIESSETVVHQGVNCSGCAISPIKGIRYACPKCFKFNLCQICEQKISHEHDLLKMRKAKGAGQELQPNQLIPYRKWKCRKAKKNKKSSSSSSSSNSQEKKCQRKNKKSCSKKNGGRKHKRSSSSSSSSSSNSKQNKFEKCQKKKQQQEPNQSQQVRKKCHWKMGPCNEENRVHWIAKKMACKLGGTEDQYQLYISQRKDKRPWQIMRQYCQENNIQWKGRCGRKQKRSQSSSSSSSQQKGNKCQRKNKRSHSKGHKGHHGKHGHGHGHNHGFGHHHGHGHSHGKYRQNKSSSSTDKVVESPEARLQRLSKKMVQKFGGNQEQYREYISKRSDKRFWQIMKQYCSENKIQWKGRSSWCDPQKRKNMKIRKLALYFNKDEQEFQSLVNENPDCRFRQLLKILKQKGTYDFNPSDQQALRKVRRRFRNENYQVDSWIKNSRLIEKKQLKIQQKVEQKINNQKQVSEKKEQSPIKPLENQSIVIEKPNPAEIRQKGRILIEMKDIFGQDKTKELFKFIDENFKLGQDKIIEKWIENQFNKSAQV